MKEAYPELIQANSLISETLKYEELKFKKLLERGMSQLNEESSELNEGDTLSGASAFKLYDTYGFPIDLTQDILKSKNINVDTEEFEDKLEQQRNLARSNWSGSGDSKTEKIWFELNAKLNPTEFLGYSVNETESAVISIISNGKECKTLKSSESGTLILNQTVFYAESGGQIGDQGKIFGNDFTFQVNDTKKKGNLILHIGTITEGKINKNDQVKCHINEERRNNCRSYHSATHILHQALRDELGGHVAQKGSLVSHDKLRFDFSHHLAMSQNEINAVELKINKVINKATDVSTKLMSPEDAIKEGALALFGEKYTDEVRVVSIGELNNKTYSIELCGGTHVNNTSEIGKVKLISESSAASGIRRIEAVRGNDLAKYNESINSKKQQSDIKKEELKKSNEILMSNLSTIKEEIDSQIKSKDYNRVVFQYCENIKSNELRPLVDYSKKAQQNNGIVVLCSKNEEKLSFVVGVTENLTNLIGADEIAKYASSISNGKGGGGRKDFAQSGGIAMDQKSQRDKIYKFIIDKLD